MAENSLYRFIDIVLKFYPKNNVSTIVELGARDCTETLEFNKIFPKADIFTFECNPNTLPICKRRIKGIDKITLIDKAVTNFVGKVKFYPINKSKTRTTWADGNQGASSLYRASGNYPVEEYVQDEIDVQAITIMKFMNEYKLNDIDLLWMDIQGAELSALKGAHNYLRQIKFIHLEVEFMQIYAEQPLFKEIKRFLTRHGFFLNSFTNFGEFSGDAIFVNRKIIPLLERPKFWARDRLIYRWHKSKPKIHQLQTNLNKSTSFIKRQSFKIKSLFLLKDLSKFRFFKKIEALRKLGIPGRHIFSYRRMFSYVWLHKGKCIFKLDPNMRNDLKQSNQELDVIIPVVPKDIAILPYCIKAVRQNLLHPINKVIVVAPDNKRIKELCRQLHCEFIDETTVLPIKSSSIKYVSGGINRAGWLFQQLIKLSADSIAQTKNILVLDADTILTKPQVMIQKNRPVFNHSDEYHLPYFTAYKKLLHKKPSFPLSFIGHYMLFNRGVLEDLRNTIEKKNNKPWYEAIIDNIDTNQPSAFSEYELYGNFYTSSLYPTPIHVYWFNRQIPYDKLSDVRVSDLVKVSPIYKSTSFHTYEKF